MKSLFAKIGGKVAEVGEFIESNSPQIKSALSEVGNGVEAQASAAQDAIKKATVRAGEVARQTIDSPQVQALSNSVTSGFSRLKDSFSTAAKSTPESNAIGSNEQAKISNAIEKLGGRDKIGVSAEAMAAAGGVAAGAAAAGTIAGAAGATTLLGSTGLASVFGGVFVAATPVGWVLGSAVVCGFAGYTLMKLAYSGAQQDIARKEMIGRLTDRLSLLQTQSEEQGPIVELKQLVVLTMASSLISDEQGRRMITLVEKGSMSPVIAIGRLKSLAIDAGVIEEKPPAPPAS